MLMRAMRVGLKGCEWRCYARTIAEKGSSGPKRASV